MVVKVERRLAVVFRRAILVAFAGVGCSTKGADVVATMDDGGIDASTGPDAATKPDAGKEAGPPDPCEVVPFTPNPPDTCGDYVRYPCGLPTGLTIRGACYFGLNDCAALCPDVHFNCHAVEGYCTQSDLDGGTSDEAGSVIPDQDGGVVIDCSTCLGSAGRVPAGLAPGNVRARSALGAYFASAARLEAASVVAFRRLREELALHGAPSELLDAARAAEQDEVRHTRAMARLARRHGGRYERPCVADVAPRSLEAIATENAAEGCARETFGALLATWQAEHVADPELGRTLAAIAEDETRHAALSWAITRWSLTKLDGDARDRMQSAWKAALADVTQSAPSSELAGLGAVAFPSAGQRAELAGELATLWSDLLAA